MVHACARNWSEFSVTVFYYVYVRVIATRCFSYSLLPTTLFPVHLMSDLFTEIVMADLDAATPMFWLVLLVDLVCLVARDANLWEDLLMWAKRQGTGLAKLFARAVQLSQMVTRGDDIGSDMFSAGDIEVTRPRRATSMQITPAMRQMVSRQTAASCCFSEILSSCILLSFALAEYYNSVAFVVHRKKGKHDRHDITMDASATYVLTYAIFLVGQLLALLISHNILEYKARRGLPDDKKYHAHLFLTPGMRHKTGSPT